MNLDALKFIVDNCPELIHQLASDAKVDPDAALGLAKMAIAGRQGFTSRQQYTFDNGVLPLIENIKCHGNWNEFDENPHCGATINEDSLTTCYEEDSFLCESCQSLHDGMMHSKARIMGQ